MKQNVADSAAQAYFLIDNSEGANTAAVVTKAASLDPVSGVATSNSQFWVVDWIGWSYNGTPGAGSKLTVQFGSTTLFDVDITDGGPGLLEFDRTPLYHTDANGAMVRGEALTITLSSGGAGVTGKVQARVR